MENVVDALKMAFAVFAFMIAFAVGIYVINQTKSTSDVMMRATDETTSMDYTQELDLDSIKAGEKRKVGIETIIPTIYKYATEKYTIIFKDGRGNYNIHTGELSGSTFMRLYYTTNYNYDVTWRERTTRAGRTTPSYVNPYREGEGTVNARTYDEISGGRKNTDYAAICTLDVSDEQRRQEIFTQTNERKKFLDVLLYGGTYVKAAFNDPSLHAQDIFRGPAVLNAENIKVTEGFAEKYKNSVFLEEVYEFTDNEVTSVEEEGESEAGYLTRRMIIYTLIL